MVAKVFRVFLSTKKKHNMKIVYEVHYYFVKVSRKEIPRLTSALGVPLDTRIQLVEFFLSRGIHKKKA